MMEPKIGTVVLNYRTYKDTIECVNSLKSQSYKNHIIIVVENGSDNNSREVLMHEFQEDKDVTLLVSKVNLGFAKGNNLGIRYAHERLECEYVFVLNSDTIVPDGIFQKVIEFDCHDIGAISPNVVDINGDKARPSENSDDILKRIKSARKSLLLAKVLSLPGVQMLYKKYSVLKHDNTEQ